MLFGNNYAVKVYLTREAFMKKILNVINSVLLASVSCLVMSTTVVAQAEELCLEGNIGCTFVLLSIPNNANNNSMMLVNKNRAIQPFSPFSTFKVPNSLIALDSQIIKNAKQPLTFDKEKYPVQKWWPSVWKLPSYNLSSAFKFSMVAIYRQLASDIGQQKMQSYVTNFAYGNQDITSGVDSFWLDGSMKISAVEQVTFLQKMNKGLLAVKPQSIELLKEVMLVESTNDYKLYAKTGAGRANGADKKDKSMLGWYIGFVENNEGVHYFAFNFTRDSYAKMKASRVVIARNHLKAAGVI